MTFTRLSLFLILVGLSRFASAQTEPADLPGTAEPDEAAQRPLLDTRAALNDLGPLPALNLPQRLPAVFTMSTEDLKNQQRFVEITRQIRSGEHDEARDWLRNYLADHPEALQVHVTLADSFFATGDYSEAKAIYQGILEKVPMQFQALNNLAWMMATVREPGIYNPEKALELAHRARMVDVNSHHVWSTLSQAYFELEQYQNAGNAITIALRMGQRQNLSVRNYVGYLIQMDRCTIAIQATSILE